MKRSTLIMMMTSLALVAGCAPVAKQMRPEVHVVLNDGQVLVGALSTPTVTLKTEFGTLKFDSKDAGELGPLEGDDMKQSDNLVKLWLRNGSEFVGGWEHPAVQVALQVGGQSVDVDVPIHKLKRMQFRGEATWSDKPLYRVLTRSGDDFFVDASASRIHFTGELGDFRPFLTEITRLERTDEETNAWRVQLKNGSRLHAEIQQEGLELTPAMGPEKIKLSWSLVARMEPAVMHAPAHHQAVVPGTSGYYSNSVQRQQKVEAARAWTHQQ